MPFRMDGTVNSAQGPALDGVLIYVCTQPASTTTIPPSPLATIFSNSLGTPLLNPIESDGLGNWFFYADPGLYTLVYYDPLQRIPTVVFPDQLLAGGSGTGSVTSVGLTMPGEFTVAGSPVVTSGTLAVSKATQQANKVYAGPAAGPDAAPTFRSLVAADITGLGAGTVSSVALTLVGSSLLSLSVSGSPITTAGTLALTVNFANQAARTFLAGPVAGGSGPVTARVMSPSDLPPNVVVAFSGTPTFDASAGLSFKMTLTGDVTVSTVSNPTAGERIVFILTQDATGARTFNWPGNFRGGSLIDTTPNWTTVQEFIYDGVASVWRALTMGISMAP